MTRLALAALLLSAAPACAAPPNLDGTWLFDAALAGKNNDNVGRFSASVVTVKGDRFSLTKMMGHTKDLTGRLAFDAADPRAVDLAFDELDFAELGAPIKIPAGTHRGRFEAAADRLTLCLAAKPDGARPDRLEASDAAFLVTLARAPAGFKEFPKEVTVRVTSPGGKPVAGATVASFMSKRVDPRKKDEDTDWHFFDDAKTGPDGTAKVKSDALPSVVRSAALKLVAYPAASPARVAGGELPVVLAPECRVVGRIVSDELTKAGGKVEWTNVYLMRDGRRVADCSTPDGAFEFLAPPGTYTLHAYGTELHSRNVAVTVPPDRTEFAAEPIALKASALALLKGKPAPEFGGVVGWSGKPVKLADLKGQYVLVDFWGYWCGPCVGAMPVLIELHEKFGGKGLAVVGVHVDGDGEVDTAAKLAEKVAGYVKTTWKGKELPFPSALVSGAKSGEGDERTRGGTPKQYGVLSYPTTILIDPEGKVVGKFHARDIKDATAAVEKLLAGKK